MKRSRITMKTQHGKPEVRKRGAILGEEVLWFANGDRTSEPTLAKVVKVDGKDGRLVQLKFYSEYAVDGLVCHLDDEQLQRFPAYRRYGAWDFHPQLAHLIDMVHDAKPMLSSAPQAAEPLAAAD